MTEQPIIFSVPMVRAILAGHKTQTRRVIGPQPKPDKARADSFIWHGGKRLLKAGYASTLVHTNADAVVAAMLKTCRYGQPGGRLWVRETWSRNTDRSCRFLADHATPGAVVDGVADHEIRWRPSIHLRRDQARLELRIDSIRVEALQGITTEDLCAEGMTTNKTGSAAQRDLREQFTKLWDSLNDSGDRGFPWRSNPWVYVITFARILH